QIESGMVKLREFRMRGPAAEVEMSGEVDLAHESQNLRVRILPSLADSASLGIGIVNPVAGVAAVIAQRILKNPLGQIFAFDYTVTGSWADPKVAKIVPPPLPEQVSN
ncbi:MAG TPA: AsmA-like C-terminal region-containing protein, partial [Burkholderiales bacterium]|nr:AsmA-like C-terminal region-containing protein [Burkholderiales bacterium]